ncbi:MAG TPA: hypothetical protein VFM14_07335 [Gemmatimonadales bacterium]|nr:hypothetical protein [Gemmatimonadales bacterium]
MAKNVSREFATMDDDERRRFALEQPAADSDPEEVPPVEFPADDPRRRRPSDARVDESTP